MNRIFAAALRAAIVTGCCAAAPLAAADARIVADPAVVQSADNLMLSRPCAQGLDAAPLDVTLTPLVALFPAYPAGAKGKGFVDVEFITCSDGRVKSAKVVKAEPAGVFEAAALKSAMSHRFRPVMQDGQAVEARSTRRFNFAPDAD